MLYHLLSLCTVRYVWKFSWWFVATLVFILGLQHHIVLGRFADRDVVLIKVSSLSLPFHYLQSEY
jgi:hypothetical protein